MILNIHNCIESLMNPEGRFRTLKGIRIVLNKHGMPECSSNSGVITFNVIYNNKPYQLKCFLSLHSTLATRANIIANYTSVKKSKYFTRYSYHTDEMLVFDTTGQYHYCDIAMQEMPSGSHLGLFVARCCGSNHRKRLCKLYDNMMNMAVWLHENKITHNRIIPRNIYINQDCEPTLINYETANIGDDLSNDNFFLGVLFSTLFSAISQPDRFYQILKMRMSYSEIASPLIEMMTEFNMDDELIPYKEFNIALHKQLDVINNWNYLCSNLAIMRKLSNKSYSSINNLLQSVMISKKITMEEPKGDFTVVSSNMNDNRRRVCRNDKYYFLDTNNREVAGPFDQAGDFVEGRACIELGDKHGLINQNGQYVIQPIYTDMSWDSEVNIAIVQHDDLWAIFNRDGEQVTTFKYEKLFISSCGLLQAKYNGKLGFVNPQGETVINFIFDDAVSFNNDGETEATIGKTRLFINTTGQVLGIDSQDVINEVYPKIELEIHL